MLNHQPSLTQCVSWEKLVKQIKNLLQEALLQLLQYDNLPTVEEKQGTHNTLNWYFYTCIQLLEDKYGLNPVVHYDEENVRGKKPDFNWQWIDNTANPNLRRRFDVECKRLGMKTNYSKEYVINGMLRFVLDEYTYGNNEPLGAMVAYIQAGNSLDDVLDSVNEHTKKQKISSIPFPQTWHVNQVTVLSNQLKREFSPIDITLEHFWLDLRQKHR